MYNPSSFGLPGNMLYDPNSFIGAGASQQAGGGY
jgi:hypothetical protein